MGDTRKAANKYQLCRTNSEWVLGSRDMSMEGFVDLPFRAAPLAGRPFSPRGLLPGSHEAFAASRQDATGKHRHANLVTRHVGLSVLLMFDISGQNMNDQFFGQ